MNNKKNIPKNVKNLFTNSIFLLIELIIFLSVFSFSDTILDVTPFLSIAIVIGAIWFVIKFYRNFYKQKVWVKISLIIISLLSIGGNVYGMILDEFSFILLAFVIISIWSLYLLFFNEDVIKYFGGKK
jgi:hypothetical protein